ncbi:cold-shock protein [Escherichia coli]|nr:cold-shock protein [Escherichia coli]NUD21667.1 cold-shock protein [Escherichia coli]
MKTQPATGETYPKSDLFNKAGSQYRTSSFDVSDMNPFGAKCIFCKSMMITFDNISQYLNASRLSLDLKK